MTDQITKFKIVIINGNGRWESPVRSGTNTTVKVLVNELQQCAQHGYAYTLNVDNGSVIFPANVMQNSVISIEMV